MKILPAIDLMDGKVVRLRQGDYDKSDTYSSDPASVAQRWVDSGAEGIHVVDLDGAKAGRPVNRKAIRAIVDSAQAPVQVGGGVRSVDIAGEYFDMGVSIVILGTAAILNPDLVLSAADLFPERILVGIDVKAGRPATRGWTQTVDTNPVALAERFAVMGVAGIVYTDISKDGMLEGPNIEGLRSFASAVDIPVIASGGVTCLDDVRAITDLASIGIESMIIGKALYDGALDLADAISAARQTARS